MSDDLASVSLEDLVRIVTLAGGSSACVEWCAMHHDERCPHWHSKPPLGDCNGFVPNRATYSLLHSML